MNYSKIYNSLVNNRVKRKKDKSTYYEEHHIIPRCMGGSDDKANLVLLTAREHFIAHRLLSKIYPDNFNLKLAVLLMGSINELGDGFRVTSRTYESLRKSVSDQRKANANQDGTMEFKFDIKVPVQISNRTRAIRLVKKGTKKFNYAFNKFLTNLVLASSLGLGLSFPRNIGRSNEIVSVHMLLKCEATLKDLGYIADVVIDSKSPLAHRKRCKVVASESISDFDECIESIYKINEFCC